MVVSVETELMGHGDVAEQVVIAFWTSDPPLIMTVGVAVFPSLTLVAGLREEACVRTVHISIHSPRSFFSFLGLKMARYFLSRSVMVSGFLNWSVPLPFLRMSLRSFGVSCGENC